MSFIFSCKGCTKRTPTCHDTCQTYKDEKAEFARKKAASEGDMVCRAYTREASERNQTRLLKKKIAAKRFKG